jgi:hypothetical protein
LPQVAVSVCKRWCPGWESNAHEEKSPEDFKSSARTGAASRAPTLFRRAGRADKKKVTCTGKAEGTRKKTPGRRRETRLQRTKNGNPKTQAQNDEPGAPSAKLAAAKEWKRRREISPRKRRAERKRSRCARNDGRGATRGRGRRCWARRQRGKRRELVVLVCTSEDC